jgi:alkylation response protein AidB-like acyl-CoA dehydrogenase
MFEWSEEQLAIRDAVRRFVEEEIKPQVDDLEHGDTPPYEVIRKLYRTFGLDGLAREGFKRQLERKLSDTPAPPTRRRPSEPRAAAMRP